MVEGVKSEDGGGSHRQGDGSDEGGVEEKHDDVNGDELVEDGGYSKDLLEADINRKMWCSFIRRT